MKCGGTKNIIKIDIVGKLENVVLFHTYVIWRKIMYNEEKIEVEVLPANEGECILVTIEKEDIHILIDGGTSETYRRFLKSRLVQLKKAGKNIDLLIVTHIDNDHIGGIIELLKENGSDIDSKIIRIKNIWHNSYKHLQIEKNGELGRSERNLLHKIISNGEVATNCNLNKNDPISAIQGTTLAGLIFEGGYHWNEQFEGMAIINNGINYQFGKECFISVLKPTMSDLEKLGKKWKRDLKKSKYSFTFSKDKLFDDAFEYYCRCMPMDGNGNNEGISYSNHNTEEMTIEELSRKLVSKDKSITNRSSISIILSYRNKKLLFLADNITDSILEYLSKIDKKYALVKVPHHGSANNINDEFIESIECDTYLISTNSEKYNHPDIETLAKIACKRTGYVKKIYFNYKIEKVVDFEKKIYGMNDIEFVYLEQGQKIYL